MRKERVEYWRGEICEAVRKSAKHGAVEHIDNLLTSLEAEVAKNYLALEAENERLQEALLDIKSGKDNPCYLADKALRGE